MTDWAGGEPMKLGYARKHNTSTDSRMAIRKVRPNGTVKFYGRIWKQRDGIQSRCDPGEIALFYDYGEAWNTNPAFRKDPQPVMIEWSQAPEPDNTIPFDKWVLA